MKIIDILNKRCSFAEKSKNYQLNNEKISNYIFVRGDEYIVCVSAVFASSLHQGNPGYA